MEKASTLGRFHAAETEVIKTGVNNLSVKLCNILVSNAFGFIICANPGLKQCDVCITSSDKGLSVWYQPFVVLFFCFMQPNALRYT